MNDKLIAITIGPVFDTISLTSKPAGLWAGSYLYSYICECLVSKIKEKNAGNIITPYFEFDEAACALHKAGIGYYHDHIVVKNVSLEDVELYIEDTKKDIGERIAADLCLAKIVDETEKTAIEEYIKKWIRIYALELEVSKNDNSILASAGYLDSMELMPSFIEVEEKNYMSMFLDNEVLKKSFIVDKENWQLFGEDHKVKSIEDIALSLEPKGEECKYKNYYALVSSDGDRIGKVLESLENDEELRNFSLKCQEYTTKACTRIKEFGGMVIYAGGDDLQFISPLMHGENSITDLIQDIVESFRTVFLSQDKYTSCKPSVSFGINIVYVKYPLYEALEESRGLLNEAKNKGRDAAVIRLEKHSGQSLKICLNGISDGIKSFNEKMSPLIAGHVNKNSEKDKEVDTVFSSVQEHIRQYRILFEKALEEDVLDNFFKNVFDNEGQKGGESYINLVKNLTILINDSKDKSMVTDKMLSLLRYAHFYGEKSDEGGKKE